MSTAPNMKMEEVDRGADGLCEGWCWASLGDVCSAPQYGWTTSANRDQGRLKLLRTSDISKEAVDWSLVPCCDEEPEDSNKYLIQIGDILVSRAGSVGISYLVSDVPPPAVFASYLIRFRPQIDARFLAFFLKSPKYWSAIAEQTAGIAVPNVNASKLKELAVPLAPLTEQARIACALQSATHSLSSVRLRVANALAILKHFRQAVLAAACSGKLTEHWRQQSRIAQTATPLEEQIRQVRQAEWKRFQKPKQGDKFGKQHLRADYVEPSNPPLPDAVPELPGTWCLLGIELLLSLKRKGMKTGPFGSSLKKSEHQSTGVPVLGIENIREMRFVEGSKIHISPSKAEELSEFDARPGDILVSRSGTVGEVCEVPPGLGEARISTNIMRVVLRPDALIPQFFCYLFNGGPFVLDQVRQLCGGSTRDFLNQQILSSITFPVPPLEEQHEIVRRVEALFKLTDAVEKRVTAASVRAETLTQAILGKAFRGELVPTEAELARRDGREYEPASVLLARIKAEREKMGKEKRSKKATKAPPQTRHRGA